MLFVCRMAQTLLNQFPEAEWGGCGAWVEEEPIRFWRDVDRVAYRPELSGTSRIMGDFDLTQTKFLDFLIDTNVTF